MKIKRKDLDNTLENVKKVSPELTNFKFVNSDSRLGKKVCLADENDHYRTDFMEVKEMYYYLVGYYDKSDNRFIKK